MFSYINIPEPTRFTSYYITLHDLQKVLGGKKSSKWIERFQKKSATRVPVYLDSEDHQDSLFFYLQSLLRTAPTAFEVGDQVQFILDVLFPEVRQFDVVISVYEISAQSCWKTSGFYIITIHKRKNMFLLVHRPCPYCSSGHICRRGRRIVSCWSCLQRKVMAVFLVCMNALSIILRILLF